MKARFVSIQMFFVYLCFAKCQISGLGKVRFSFWEMLDIRFWKCQKYVLANVRYLFRKSLCVLGNVRYLFWKILDICVGKGHISDLGNLRYPFWKMLSTSFADVKYSFWYFYFTKCYISVLSHVRILFRGRLDIPFGKS